MACNGDVATRSAGGVRVDLVGVDVSLGFDRDRTALRTNVIFSGVDATTPTLQANFSECSIDITSHGEVVCGF